MTHKNKKVIIEGWIEKRTINVVNTKQFKPVFGVLSYKCLRYQYSEEPNPEMDKELSIKELSNIQQIGRCLQFSQKCSSRGGVKLTCLQMKDVQAAGKWFSGFLSAGVKLPKKDHHHGNFKVPNQFSSMFSPSKILHVKTSSNHRQALPTAKKTLPENLGRVEALVVLEYLSRNSSNFLTTVLHKEASNKKVVGIALAVFLSHNIIFGETKFSFPESWLVGLLEVEVGLHESNLRPFPLMLREEKISSIALSTFLRFVFHFGSLTHIVTSPLLKVVSDDSFDGSDEETINLTCASSIQRLKQSLELSTPAALAVKAFARCSHNVAIAAEAKFPDTKVEGGAEEEEDPPEQPVQSEDYLFALLGGGIFLRVLCPALLAPLPPLDQNAESRNSVTVAAASVLCHLILAHCDNCLDESEGAPVHHFQSLATQVPFDLAIDALDVFVDTMNCPRTGPKRSGVAPAKVIQRVANAVPSYANGVVPLSDSLTFQCMVTDVREIYTAISAI